MWPYKFPAVILTINPNHLNNLHLTQNFAKQLYIFVFAKCFELFFTPKSTPPGV